MGIIDWLKSKLMNEDVNDELNLDLYKDNKLLKKKWIEPYFAVQLFRPQNMNIFEFIKEQEELVFDWIGKIQPATVDLKINKNNKEALIVDRSYLLEIFKSFSIKTYFINALPQKYFRALQYKENIKSDTAFLLIRFPSVTQSQINFFEKNNIIRTIPEKESRNYNFSPLQIFQYFEISRRIEYQVMVFSGNVPSKLKTLINGVGKEIFVTESDEIQYFSYPLSKRAELYSAFPEIEVKIFGSTFLDFAKDIFDRENESIYMKRNVERLKNILKKYKIKLINEKNKILNI